MLHFQRIRFSRLYLEAARGTTSCTSQITLTWSITKILTACFLVGKALVIVGEGLIRLGSRQKRPCDDKRGKADQTGPGGTADAADKPPRTPPTTY